MNKMNITEYIGKPDDLVMYYGKTSFKPGLYFENGDEHFYHFIGKNSCYSILELLHPDDVEQFEEAVRELPNAQPQCLIARVKNANNQYRCLYLELNYNGVMFDDFASFDMEFCDIIAIKDRYVIYMRLMKKYRHFMSLASCLYFEYEYQTDIFKIYQYMNTKSIPLFSGKLAEINQDILASANIPMLSKAELNVFSEHLINKSNLFDVTVDLSLFDPTTPYKRCRFKGKSMYVKDIKSLAIGIIEPIERRQDNKENYFLSDSALDPGTGLLNKRAINEYTISKLSEIADKNGCCYLAVMDIDDFKNINDTFGHMFGDEVLTRVSEIITSVLTERGVTGRFGGDEFMIFFEHVTEEEELRRIMSTINKHINWAFNNSKEGLTVTTSCGIAKFPNDGITYEELFQKADHSLYIAKAKGKNRYIIYDKNKHGTVKTEANSDRKLGIKASMGEDKKAAALSEMILALHRDGTDAIMNTMDQLRDYFDIDGIAIYTGPTLERTYALGKYINPIKNLSFMFDPAYQEFFNEHGIFMENMNRLEMKVPDAFQMYEQQETKKIIQYAHFKDGIPDAVVSFDFFNRSPKSGATDFGLITIIGRLLAEVAAGKN
ncbi:MAG: GGDEF domain-containing protein [Lachnospiraceae bacterium]|nr:GGDEF domain-containing protein [Lachnospiraceae bacterium]